MKPTIDDNGRRDNKENQLTKLNVMFDPNLKPTFYNQLVTKSERHQNKSVNL